MAQEADSAAFEHRYFVAPSALELHELIQGNQQFGYELVTVACDKNDHWHAFLKRDRSTLLQSISVSLDEVSEGISMLLDNHPGFVTAGRMDDLQSVVGCILKALENQAPT